MQDRIRKLANQLNGSPYSVAVAIFFLMAFLFFLFTPITGGDNDLWYHLNSGRHIIETGQLTADSSHISFISPPRGFIDYYWFFQVITYLVHMVSGYQGLVIQRALVYAFTVGLIFLYVKKSGAQRGHFSGLGLYEAAVVVLISTLVVQRFQLVRPHAFSYLFIAAFLLAFEYRTRLMYWLPAIGVLWMNMHGIEYPVMLLVSFAYLLEVGLERRKKGEPFSGAELRVRVLPAVAALFAIFLTPHGSALLGLPFTSTSDAAIFIPELQRIDSLLWFGVSFNLNNGIPSYVTFLNILLVFILIAFARAIYSRTLRPAHLVLLVGGTYLLSMGVRFVCEFALLSLPLLVGAGRVEGKGAGQGRGGFSPATLAYGFLLIVLPFSFFMRVFPLDERYPFSEKDLPAGVVEFLNRTGKVGNLLNEPFDGGYLQWKLDRGYRIFMDMELPFLFHDEDAFIALGAYHDPLILDNLARQYEISYIMAPLDTPGFISVIKSLPEYELVFFDDRQYLYANRKLQGELVERYGLRHLDPFGLSISRLYGLSAKQREGYIRELERMHEIYPDGVAVNQALGTLYVLSGETDRAIEHADNVIALAPLSVSGYFIRGEARLVQKQYALAELDLIKAQSIAKGSTLTEVKRKLFLCYIQQKKNHEAFETYRSMFIKDYYAGATNRDLYTLGMLALDIGQTDEALKFFRYAKAKTSVGDRSMRARIEAELNRFELTPLGR